MTKNNGNDKNGGKGTTKSGKKGVKAYTTLKELKCSYTKKATKAWKILKETRKVTIEADINDANYGGTIRTCQRHVTECINTMRSAYNAIEVGNKLDLHPHLSKMPETRKNNIDELLAHMQEKGYPELIADLAKRQGELETMSQQIQPIDETNESSMPNVPNMESTEGSESSIESPDSDDQAEPIEQQLKNTKYTDLPSQETPILTALPSQETPLLTAQLPSQETTIPTSQQPEQQNNVMSNYDTNGLLQAISNMMSTQFHNLAADIHQRVDAIHQRVDDIHALHRDSLEQTNKAVFEIQNEVALVKQAQRNIEKKVAKITEESAKPTQRSSPTLPTIHVKNEIGGTRTHSHLYNGERESHDNQHGTTKQPTQIAEPEPRGTWRTEAQYSDNIRNIRETIAPFNGEADKYPLFRAMFDALVDDNPNIDVRVKKDPVMEEFKNLTNTCDKIDEKMRENFDDLKAFVSQYSFYNDVPLVGSLLAHYMKDAMVRQTSKSRDAFKREYEANTPLEYARRLNIQLSKATTNPLQMLMMADPLKGQNTFEKWEEIFESVMTQLCIIEAVACQYLKGNNRNDLERITKEFEKFERKLAEWRTGYMHDDHYWPDSVRRFVEDIQDHNGSKTSEEIAELIVKKLDTVLTTDTLTVVVFRQEYGFSKYFNIPAQVVSSLNRGNCNVYVFRSRLAAAEPENLEKFKKSVEAASRMTFPYHEEKGLPDDDELRMVTNGLFRDSGFVLLIKNGEFVGLRSTKTGAEGHYRGVVKIQTAPHRKVHEFPFFLLAVYK